MSGYVPNNRNERPAPTPAPYNGDFHRQAPRPLEGTAAQNSSCLVGLRFVWDNGECLGANLPYSLTPAGGNPVRGSLDARSSLIQTIQGREYEAQLLADADVDSDIASARAELQAVLNEILAAERAEAARLQAIQDQRSALSNYVHRRLAVGKGFFLGAWGLLKTAKEFSDLVNPFTAFSNALRSAWQARASEGETWLTAYNRQFSAEQHRELVEALGFDPSSITREQLAEAYELACFIYEDGPSKAMLGRFAVDYAKAQNVEEVAEFSGGALFEIVLAALLIVFTGGVGLAARGAASVSYLDKLARLGNAFRRLGAALKRARIRRGGRATGSGTGARTVEVERPPLAPTSQVDRPSSRLDSESVALERIRNNPKGPDLSQRPPGTVANQQAVNDLQAGRLPGQPIGGPGTPREMPASIAPSATAEDFAIKALGRDPTQAERAIGSRMNKGDCAGCWVASPDEGKSYITYRPAGKASAETAPTTSTVEINYREAGNQINNGKPLKLKFPQTGNSQ
ncbi:hypothetical protein SAMN03159475_1890 [Pseudomonas sp. NFPP33]|nr:hypothetical protein [Pseudomonas sp. NFPP33]SDA56855.1 hypothetical protein SAMN03159475_1890 [Pseudomonas sp. NFPP33]